MRRYRLLVRLVWLAVVWVQMPVTTRAGDVSRWRERARIHTSYGGTKAVAFSADGRWLAASCFFEHEGAAFHSPVGGAVMLIEVRPGKLREVLRSEEFGAPCAVAVTPRGKVVAAWEDGQVVTWDRETGKHTRRPRVKTYGHSAALSADGRLLACSCNDGRVRFWDLKSRKEVAALPAGIFANITLAPEHNLAAFSIELNRISENEYSLNWQRPTGVPVWDLKTRKLRTRVPTRTNESFSVAFSPDGKLLALGMGNGEIRLWSFSEKLTVRSIQAHENNVWDLAFSPDGTSLASSTQLAAEVKVWRLDDRSSHAELDAPGEAAHLAFSPDGKTLAAVCENGAAALWDVPAARRAPE